MSEKESTRRERGLRTESRESETGKKGVARESETLARKEWPENRRLARKEWALDGKRTEGHTRSYLPTKKIFATLLV